MSMKTFMEQPRYYLTNIKPVEPKRKHIFVYTCIYLLELILL